jgi:hypothetical protein
MKLILLLISAASAAYSVESDTWMGLSLYAIALVVVAAFLKGAHK